MPAPYLRRVYMDRASASANKYPFCLPIFRAPFSLQFTRPVTILVGENGSGKSTLLEGIAALAGFDEVGGGKGYRPVNHSRAIEGMGSQLADSLKASWLPKISRGWFFRAESFFTVSRYLDEAAVDANETPPDFLSYSHGEGFLRFFQERCRYQGLYLIDEPEAALSPARQLDFLKLLAQIDASGVCQVVMATHSPMLMAYPKADLMLATKYGFMPTKVEETDHFRLTREFCLDPTGFMQAILNI